MSVPGLCTNPVVAEVAKDPIVIHRARRKRARRDRLRSNSPALTKHQRVADSLAGWASGSAEAGTWNSNQPSVVRLRRCERSIQTRWYAQARNGWERGARSLHRSQTHQLRQSRCRATSRFGRNPRRSRYSKSGGAEHHAAVAKLGGAAYAGVVHKAADRVAGYGGRNAPILEPKVRVQSVVLCRQMPNNAIDRSAQKLRFWVPVALRAPAPGHCERWPSRGRRAPMLPVWVSEVTR